MERSLWEMARKAHVVTFIGAGGKTTCLNRLTEELAQLGEPVVATTTTKVYPLPFPSLWQDASEAPPLEMLTPCFWYSGIEEVSGKWNGISVDSVDHAIRDKGESQAKSENPLWYWVIEGDGARERKLKCWDTSHEPQIPRLTEAAVLVIDGQLWGKTLLEKEIHRLEICPHLLGQVWTPELAWQYILNSPVFDMEYQEISWIILFNEWGFDALNGQEAKKRLQSTFHDLVQLGTEFYVQGHCPEGHRPKHLRLASGDVREGSLQWYDLW